LITNVNRFKIIMPRVTKSGPIHCSRELCMVVRQDRKRRMQAIRRVALVIRISGGATEQVVHAEASQLGEVVTEGTGLRAATRAGDHVRSLRVFKAGPSRKRAPPCLLVRELAWQSGAAASSPGVTRRAIRRWC
jgi:hypothetical protein